MRDGDAAAAAAAGAVGRRGPPPTLPIASPARTSPQARVAPPSLPTARVAPPSLASLSSPAGGSGRAKRQAPSLRALALGATLGNSGRRTPPSLESLRVSRVEAVSPGSSPRSPPPSLAVLRASKRSAAATVVGNPLAMGGSDSEDDVKRVDTPEDMPEDVPEDAPEDLSSEQLREGGRKMKRDARVACFDSFDLDGDDSLSVEELAMAFNQLGLVLSTGDLQSLKDKYDENGDGVLNKSEFVHMVDDFMRSSPQTFTADDWCPAKVCCCSLDCVNWGHRSTEMDNGDLITTGTSGPCGYSRLSSSVNVSVEMPKAKWMHVAVGATDLTQLRMYMWESLFVFVVVIATATAMQPYKSGMAALPAIALGGGWATLRTIMFFRRRRGVATVFAAGNPVDAPKGTFPLRAGDADKAIDHFLRCKGVKLAANSYHMAASDVESMEAKQQQRLQASACPACGGADWLPHARGCKGSVGNDDKEKPPTKAPHVILFDRDQWSGLCSREKHELEVGESFYKITRKPALASAKCQLQRREWMAGQVRDVGWVHTARYGRDVFRLVWWCFQALCWTVLVALLISIIVPHLVSDDSRFALCSHHALCDDFDFSNDVEVVTGHCSPDCFFPCSNMTCGGSGSTCKHTDDGVCDEPFVCVPGTDAHDCHTCDHSIVTFVAGVRREYLATTNNSICDEPYDCPHGTDTIDCENEGDPATCMYHDDGHCDESHLVDGEMKIGPCAKGSDYIDCLYDSEADRLLADERLYVLELEEMYNEKDHQFAWLSTVVDDSIKTCQLVSDEGSHVCVPQACIDVTILEKCSGCVNGSNHSTLGAAECAPGMPDYPNNTVLCQEATRAGEISRTHWCHLSQHSGRLPCECMGFWEKWYPSSDLFWVLFVVLYLVVTIGIFAMWMIYTPAFVEVGHPGMSALTGRAQTHAAWAYIQPMPADRNRVVMTLLQEKLGRHPSPEPLRAGWVHKPKLKHLLTGYSETMVIRRDTVTLVTKGGVPPFPCCRAWMGDSHEYTVLLQDVNFVEIGAELHPVFHNLAMSFLTFALALFFSSFITGGVYQTLEHGVCDWRGEGGDWTDDCAGSFWSIRPRTNDEIDNIKWTMVVSSIAAFFLFDWIAGAKKRGYVLVNVSPGGTERGEGNPFAGTSPFYIRLMPGAPDSNSTRYKEVINVIRSAAKHSKKLGKGDKRGILRFRTAVGVVLRGIKAGHIILIKGRALPWDGPTALAQMQSLQSEGVKKMLSEGCEQCITEEVQTDGVPDKAKEPSIAGSAFKDDEDIVQPKGMLRSVTTKLTDVKGAYVQNKEQKMDAKSDKQGIIKVFVEIDIDSSGTISFAEFSKWLSDWVSRVLTEEGEDATMKSKELQKKCKVAFDTVNTDGDEELSMSEFQQFMAKGAIDMFKECGLWGKMMTSNLFDVSAIESCFDRFDIDESGEMDTTELMAAFHDLDKRPTTEEVDMLLHVYDDDHDGVLSKNEFTRLMLEYTQNQKALTDFAERNWCPINLFGLDFDWLPWGYQYTSLIGDEIVSRGDSGFGGLHSLSNSNYSSIELSKTRWMHVEGHPAPFWKLNLYLAEALLLFHFVHTHPWWQAVPLAPMDRTYLAEVLAIVWYIGRGVTFFLRTRGVATSYSWGKPVQTSQHQQSKCDFPVPIMQLEEVTQAFLDVKGVSKRDAARADAYRTKLPGYGFFPLRFKQMRGIHSAYFGQTHFKLEKVNGGGGNRNTRRFSKVDYLVGLVDDIKWVHTYKLGKSIGRLLTDWLKAMFNGALIVLPIAIALSKSNCKESLDLHRPGLITWNITLTEQNIWSPEQEVFCSSFYEDPKLKPGRPCVCPLRTHGPRICNAKLDPNNALIDTKGWCGQFRKAANAQLQVTDMVPCECMSVIEKYVPDFTSPLFIGLWLAVVVPVCLGTFALWLLYTPVWGELGVQGVDAKAEGHFATFRISQKNLFERVLQKRYAVDLIRKISELKNLRIAEGAAEDSWRDVGEAGAIGDTLGQHDVTEDGNMHDSVNSLAARLYGLIDEDNTGFIEDGALQRCNTQTSDSWVDEVHKNMMAELKTRRLGAERSSTETGKEFKQRKKGAKLSENIMKSSDGEATIKMVEQAIKAKNPVKYRSLGDSDSDGHDVIDTVDLTDFGVTPEATTVFHKEKEVQHMLSEINKLNGAEAAAAFADTDGVKKENKRVQGKLLHLNIKKDKIEGEIKELKKGMKIARLNYMQLFTSLTEEYQLPVGHSYTRSQIAMKVLGRKIRRPLRHRILREWKFRPLLAYILRGEKQELMLHEDYVTLRLRGGSPVCCCCWELATSTDDYNILLQDIYFIETGHDAMTGIVINSTVVFVVGLCVALLTYMYAMASKIEEEEYGVHLLGGVDEADESKRRESLYAVASEEFVLACVPIVVVVLLAATNKLRRPYVHLGCLPGGGQNGRKNSLGGGSPFHITLKKGDTIEAARDLADWVRGAAAKSRQDDIARMREMALKVDRNVRAEKISSHVETHTRVGASHHHAGGGARVEKESTTTADVVTGHMADEVSGVNSHCFLEGIEGSGLEGIWGAEGRPLAIQRLHFAQRGHPCPHTLHIPAQPHS